MPKPNTQRPLRTRQTQHPYDTRERAQELLDARWQMILATQTGPRWIRIPVRMIGTPTLGKLRALARGRRVKRPGACSLADSWCRSAEIQLARKGWKRMSLTQLGYTLPGALSHGSTIGGGEQDAVPPPDA